MAEFVDKAIKIHGNKYDYSLVDYKHNKAKVKITCRIHGEFEQTPNNHLNGQGCPLCGRINQSKKSALSHDEFVSKSIKIHGDVYDYLSAYENHKSKVKLKCRSHDYIFEVNANKHLCRKQGCPICSKERLRSKTLMTTEEFINKAKLIFGDVYDYSHLWYVDNKSKVKIGCKEHGYFWQYPSNHLRGKGCLKCSIDSKQIANSLTNEQFVDKAIKIYGDSHDYSLVDYVNNNTPVTIICKKHGLFNKHPKSYFNGHGCPDCYTENNFLNTKKFIDKAIDIHDDKYDYSITQYTSYQEKLDIICKKHGLFSQRAAQHLRGYGCSKCCVVVSKFHKEIAEYIKKCGVKYILNDRCTIPPKELDIFINDHNLAIECNGLYWHSYDRHETNDEIVRHKLKTDLCDNLSIRLFQIFENEWRDKKEILCSMIRNKLGLSNKIYARKCFIRLINNTDYKDFMDTNHLGGYVSASVKIGLIHDNEIVGIMSFRKHNIYDWEIARYAVKIGNNIVGGASKLFKFFRDNYNPTNVMTYSDRRFGNGDVYQKMGFSLIGMTKPGYYYTDKVNVFSRQQFQKHKLKNKLKNFDHNLSESCNMFINGYRRIWDCGHCKYIWRHG